MNRTMKTSTSTIQSACCWQKMNKRATSTTATTTILQIEISRQKDCGKTKAATHAPTRSATFTDLKRDECEHSFIHSFIHKNIFSLLQQKLLFFINFKEKYVEHGIFSCAKTKQFLLELQ